MGNNFWFWVALVEFVILALLVGPAILSAVQKRLRKEHGEMGGRLGVIKNVEYATKGIGHNPVTTFEIHESDGNVYYGAMNDHVTEVKEGTRIEFWPSLDRSIANMDVQKSKVNPDGTTTRWTVNVCWYPLKKYRILPEDTPESGMSPAGDPA